MKSIPLIASAAIALGFSLGWGLKPGPAPTPEDAGAAHRPERPRSRPPQPWASEDPGNHSRKTSVRPVTRTDADETTQTEESLVAAVTAEGQERDESLIAEWVEALDLSADQEAQLRQHFAERRESIAHRIKEGDTSDAPDLISTDGLDEFFADQLDAGQEELYQQKKDANRLRKVESRALRELARLNEAIELGPEQRDAVYELLYDEANGMTSDTPTAAKDSKDGTGIGLKAGDLEHSGGQKPMAPAAGFATDQELQELWQAETEKQIEQLAGILDPAQLAAYRQYLDSRQGFLLGAVSP